jgi:biotin transport system substrate-specific component
MIVTGRYDPRAVRPDAATLRLAVIPRSGLIVDALLVVAGATIMALSAQVSIPLPFTPVPITGQTFAVVLVGSSLGAVLGFSSVLLYWLVGIAGAPVYAQQTGGWETFMGPTGGYIIGFMLAALVTGLLAERRWDRRFRSALSAMLMGNVLIYLCGLPWLAAEIDTNLEQTLEAGLYPFVIGDVLKLYLAGALVPLAWAAVRRLRGQ